MKNVLIIMTDQLRRDVLGCYGGKEVETPYIDSLAEEGILLENCYTPSAVCTPSRGCFITGRFPMAALWDQRSTALQRLSGRPDM